jgi:hypothetical protein
MQHDTEVVAATGLRVFVMIYDLCDVPVLARRVTVHRINVNAIQQPVELLRRQFDHRLLPAWPNKEVLLKTANISQKPVRSYDAS